jgi:hypothetical protein
MSSTKQQEKETNEDYVKVAAKTITEMAVTKEEKPWYEENREAAIKAKVIYKKWIGDGKDFEEFYRGDDE